MGLAANEVEPNDNAASANAITADSAAMVGQIVPGGDIDWFAFTANAGTSYTIGTSSAGGTDVDTQVELIAPDGTTWLASNDDYWPGTFSCLTWTCSTGGIYFVTVMGYDDTLQGDYRLQVYGIVGDMYEPDDLFSQATVTAADGTGQSHTLCPGGDLDWLQFSASAGQTYTIATSHTGLPATTDTELLLYDATLTQVAQHDDNIWGDDLYSTIVWSCPASGTYYLLVRVSAYYQNPAPWSGPYMVSVSGGAGPAGRISLTMNPNPVQAGSTSTATVVDGLGNDVTSSCTLSIQWGAGGSWAGPVYTSQRMGNWTVTATYGPYTATQTLTVNRGILARLDISPDAASISTAENQTYTAQAFDTQGNCWTPPDADLDWTHDGTGGFAGSTYTPGAGDAGNTVDIHAALEGLDSDHAALAVHGASGPGLVLAWDKDDQTFYLCANPADPQSADVAGRIPSANGTYTVNGVTVTVAGAGSTRSVTINNSHHVVNSLQFRWYLRGGRVFVAYMTSSLGGVVKTATYYSSGTTYVDGQYKPGFWGLTHTLDLPDPTSITCGSAQQP